MLKEKRKVNWKKGKCGTWVLIVSPPPSLFHLLEATNTHHHPDKRVKYRNLENGALGVTARFVKLSRKLSNCMQNLAELCRILQNLEEPWRTLKNLEEPYRTLQKKCFLRVCNRPLWTLELWRNKKVPKYYTAVLALFPDLLIFQNLWPCLKDLNGNSA